MSILSKSFNEFFYAWGDNDPKKEVLRYGKYVSLKRLNEYDDYVYYRPRRKLAGGVVFLGGLSLMGVSGHFLKAKYDKRKTDREISDL